jgi:hypothetical protein
MNLPLLTHRPLPRVEPCNLKLFEPRRNFNLAVAILERAMHDRPCDWTPVKSLVVHRPGMTSSSVKVGSRTCIDASFFEWLGHGAPMVLIRDALYTVVKDFYHPVWKDPSYLFPRLLDRPGAIVELRHDS